MDIDLFRVKDPFENIFNPIQFFADVDFSFHWECVSNTDIYHWHDGREHKVLSRDNYRELLKFVSEFNRVIFSIEEKRRSGFEISQEYTKGQIIRFVVDYDAKEWFWKLYFEKDWITYHKPYPTPTELFEHAKIREKAKDSLYEMVYGNNTGNPNTGTTYYAIYKEGENPVYEKNIVAGTLFRKSIGVGGTSYRGTQWIEYIINPI